MPDEAIKTYFRQWVEGAIEAETTRACPWHVVEQYEAENSTRLRGVRAKSSRSQHEKPQDESCKQGTEPAEDASDHERDRREEPQRKFLIFNKKHDYFIGKRAAPTEHKKSAALCQRVS